MTDRAKAVELHERALNCMETGGFKADAIRWLKAATEAAPTFAEPWETLYDVYSTMGRSHADDAIAAINKYIELKGIGKSKPAEATRAPTEPVPDPGIGKLKPPETSSATNKSPSDQDIAIIRDKSGGISGLWLRQADAAYNRDLLSMILIRFNAVEDTRFALLRGDYRVVPNTNDDQGGCFVMFGSAVAPGEAVLQTWNPQVEKAPAEKSRRSRCQRCGKEFDSFDICKNCGHTQWWPFIRTLLGGVVFAGVLGGCGTAARLYMKPSDWRDFFSWAGWILCGLFTLTVVVAITEAIKGIKRSREYGRRNEPATRLEEKSGGRFARAFFLLILLGIVAGIVGGFFWWKHEMEKSLQPRRELAQQAEALLPGFTYAKFREELSYSAATLISQYNNNEKFESPFFAIERSGNPLDYSESGWTAVPEGTDRFEEAKTILYLYWETPDSATERLRICFIDKTNPKRKRIVTVDIDTGGRTLPDKKDKLFARAYAEMRGEKSRAPEKPKSKNSN